MSKAQSLPAGWYPDPDEGGENRLRWFDGDDWTENTAPGPTPYEQQMLAEAQRTRTAAEVHARGWYNIGTVFWVALLIGVIILLSWQFSH